MTKWIRNLMILACLLGIGAVTLSSQGGQWEQVAAFRWLKMAFDYTFGAMFAIAAVVNIRAWIERKFWFPAYVHVLAIFSYGTCLLIFDVFGSGRWVSGSFLALLVPCLVYSAFVVLGGVEAAAERRDGRIWERSRRETAKRGGYDRAG